MIEIEQDGSSIVVSFQAHTLFVIKANCKHASEIVGAINLMNYHRRLVAWEISLSRCDDIFYRRLADRSVVAILRYAGCNESIIGCADTPGELVANMEQTWLLHSCVTCGHIDSAHMIQSLTYIPTINHNCQVRDCECVEFIEPMRRVADNA